MSLCRQSGDNRDDNPTDVISPCSVVPQSGDNGADNLTNVIPSVLLSRSQVIIVLIISLTLSPSALLSRSQVIMVLIISLTLSLSVLLSRSQVIIVLTQLEGSGGFSITHRLTHRVSFSGGLADWGPAGTGHQPAIGADVAGLHIPRPI